jgi:CO/xanthine dehydrogenase FAD-binding subunit
MVRAKQGLVQPEAVISLKNLNPELAGVREQDGRLKIGALTTLSHLARHAQVVERLPGLAEALLAIGAETLQQRVGTIGGNLGCQTRCLYYNQTAFWRSGLAPCFKLGGEVCHPGGATADRCRSVCQADAAVMLMALDARVSLSSVNGVRELSLEEFYTGKGEEPHAWEPTEILTEISVDLPSPGSGSAYYKLAARGAIDFPVLSAAVDLGLADGKVSRLRLALGAVYAAPLLLKDAAASLIGQPLSEEAIAQVAKRAGSHAEPFFIENLSAPAAWRQEMVPVVVRRAMARAAEMAGGA